MDLTEASFLQGCVAALMSETQKVGFVGGGDNGSINEILAGWQQGIQYINNGTNDVVVYANTFTDPTLGKDYALQLIAGGVDIIFGAAGGTGTGCAQAAEEQGIMYAACDVHYDTVAPTSELGSVISFYDKMVIAFINDALNDKYEGGISKRYGLAEGAALYEFANNGRVPQSIKDQIEEISSHISAGEISVSTQPLHK